MTQEKVDLVRSNPAYKATKKMVFSEVPDMNFLQIDGKGNPDKSMEFQDAIEALYAISYGLKFMVKKGDIGIDYHVAPLEGLWWAKDMNDFRSGKKDNWLWTLMIMQPDFITGSMIAEAKYYATEKKDLAALHKMRFSKFAEGTSAQVLYTGPFDKEHDTILALHEFIKSNGYELHGKHHEIYLSDMRRTAPEKLRTIIRQPVKK